MGQLPIEKLIPHQGCVITPDGRDLKLVSIGQNWVMSAALLPEIWTPPFVIHVVGKTDSTNLRIHWHQGELIFNWECSVRELRVHDPATGQQTGLKDKGFITPNEFHDITWEIRLDGMKVIVDGETRYECTGNYSGIASAPSVGPCFGSRLTISEFKATGPY